MEYFFLVKKRRDGYGGLYAKSYFNQAHMKFAAKCFAAKLDMLEAQEEQYIQNQKWQNNPFVTFEIEKADDTKYIKPPEKVISMRDKTYEETYEQC